ncbi:MAG: hypothetical protein JWL61_1484 [Gemmatimonadetes bacterium]|nr:hypothetical protein [Gemmatimonadota bacterium]
MKMLSKAVGVLALIAMLAPGAASAQTPPANTGATGNVNGVFQDALWQVSTNGGTTWSQAYQVQSPPGAWQTATPAYSWISATSSGTGGGGDYYFRTLFDLSGYDPTTAVMTFQCAIDNFPAQAGGYYSLNGGAYGGSCGNQPSYQFTGVNTVNSGFTGGINSLVFHVTGDAVTDGLVVGDMGLSASAVTATPEPASMVLVATGLLGVLGVARRRRA